ncbi:hypothetical protein U9M48_002547, partial [Paspalum notatum var. saurae]
MLASRRGLPTVLFVQAYEKENVEGESARAYDEATVVEQVVENNVNELNEIGIDEQGERSETVREPRGEVDEGEEIPGLVEQMQQREYTEADVRVDEDSDHEDDTLNQVPSQWTNYDHSQLLVNEGETVAWEYSENQVSVGAIYHSKIELKEAVKRWSAKCLRKEFRVVKSSPQVYDVKCIRDDCPFRVHAYLGKYDTFWTVSRIEHHTCIIEELESQHRNLTADFVAQHMYSKIVNNPGYKPKAIINSIDDDFQYKISYSKAYRAKQKALEMRWGTYEASYHNLPRVLNTLLLPPSDMHRWNLPNREVKGTMLTAIAADGNNQDRRDVCVIHDRHGGIMQAVQDLQEGSVQRQRTPKWVDLKSRWCMRHMGANFQKQFKSKKLTTLFKRLCNQNQERKFNVLWKKLDEHTKKQAAELSRRGVIAEDEQPIAMENVGLDGPNVRRRPGRSVKSFSEWIEHEPKEKWSSLHDEGDARYGIMTTNLAEVCNWVLRGSRSMPLVGIVEFYIYRTAQYFRERYPKAKKVFLDHRFIYGQKFFEYMAKANKKAAEHRVKNMGVTEHRFEVLCRDKGRRGGNHERHVQECVMYNNHCVCTCQKPRLYHRPCTHVIAACQEVGGLNTRMFVSPYYMKDAIYHTWKYEIYGFAIVGNFTGTPDGVPDFIPNPHPDMKQQIGRRKTRRIRNNMDDAEAGPRVVICSRCNEFGHTYKTCNNIAQGTVSNIPETGSSSQAMHAPQGYVTPELLDAATDRKHRSYFSAVLGSSLGQFRARVPMETMCLDPRWLPRLRASGLLPLARLVEGEGPRFSYDFSLLATLVDRWRPETHTLHLTVGEMAPTLQDVSYLLGLPLRGDAMGPTDVGQGWRDDLLDRFGRVERIGTAKPYREFAPTHTGGPPKWWILQFKADDIRAVATEYEVARHLEAYVLWLMGWVMFCSFAGSFVPKHLLPFARYVADAPLEAIPQFSWGSAVLAATYRGMCTGCFKSSGAEPIFGGCPLLLQLWAHERFQIGRPAVVHSPYQAYILDDVDGPTMGSLWCDRRFAYAHVQTRKSYPDFVGQFDVLRDDEVRWEPYSEEAVESRAPEGLSPLCVRDAEYWRTRRPLVFDIYVEEHAVHRVLRQLGLFQEIVVPQSLLPSHVHRFHDVVRQIHEEAVAYSRSSLTMAPQQHKAAYDKIAELCRRVTRSLSCRADDVGLPPQQPMFRAPASTPPRPRPIPLYAQTPPMTYPPTDMTPVQPPTIATEPAKLHPVRREQQHLAQSLFASPTHDEIAYSQLQDVFDEFVHGGRRFYRCPFGYNSHDMGNCHFTKWVDPPNYDHVDNYIGHLKNKIHELEYKVKALEDGAEKNALVVGLEDDPRCPDSF